MNVYLATATCDWGHIYSDLRIEAGKFSTAFNRAGYFAQQQARRRPRSITIKLTRV